MDAALHRPTDRKWRNGPPSLPPGAKIAVLEGDPSKLGLSVFHVKAPVGYEITPHTHPNPERVTVVSGTFNRGLGDTFDPKECEALPAGTFGTWPAGMKHFVWCEGETVVQFLGNGPWQIDYLDPSDGPRKE